MKSERFFMIGKRAKTAGAVLSAVSKLIEREVTGPRSALMRSVLCDPSHGVRSGSYGQLLWPYVRGNRDGSYERG